MPIQDEFNKIKNLFSLRDYDIISIFPYGSRVYGTHSEKSDFDFIAVFKDGTVKDEFSLEKNRYNIHTYNYTSFIKLIEKHKISALECISLTEDKIICNRKTYNFKLDVQILRSSISEKVSHSWVKAKKKFEIEKDKNIYIAKKSLFHSFRIINFGKQIVDNGKIYNFSAENDLWIEIINNQSEDWKDYFNLYKTKHNKKLTEFRELAPKK